MPALLRPEPHRVRLPQQVAVLVPGDLQQGPGNRNTREKLFKSLVSIMGILPSNISQRKRKKKEEKEENAISIKFLVFNIGPP